jgi:hypothetical protein
MAETANKTSIIDAIRRLAKELGHPPTRNEFREKSGVSEHYLLKYFPSFREALRISGLEPNSTNIKLEDVDLLLDWGSCVRQNQHIPTRYEYMRLGKYGPATFQNHFGTWSSIPTKFKQFAQGKPEWTDVLELLPTEEPKALAKTKSVQVKTKRQLDPGIYVDPGRLNQLCAIKSERFDLIKLIRLCEELNMSYKNESYFSAAMLVRAILDHVPPIFECRDFEQVASNYGGGSFKKSMQQLNNSSRNIADRHLHSQIRKKENLPLHTQVYFANDLDVLLEEIVTILK